MTIVISSWFSELFLPVQNICLLISLFFYLLSNGVSYEYMLHNLLGLYFVDGVYFNYM